MSTLGALCLGVMTSIGCATGPDCLVVICHVPSSVTLVASALGAHEVSKTGEDKNVLRGLMTSVITTVPPAGHVATVRSTWHALYGLPTFPATH